MKKWLQLNALKLSVWNTLTSTVTHILLSAATSSTSSSSAIINRNLSASDFSHYPSVFSTHEGSAGTTSARVFPLNAILCTSSPLYLFDSIHGFLCWIVSKINESNSTSTCYNIKNSTHTQCINNN